MYKNETTKQRNEHATDDENTKEQKLRTWQITKITRITHNENHENKKWRTWQTTKIANSKNNDNDK